MSDLIYEEVWFTNFDDVMQAIMTDNVHIACRSMPAIGLQSIYCKEVKQLVSACLNSHEEWIRRAAFLCLYHLYVRFGDKVCTDADFIKTMLVGIMDKSNVVKDIVDQILIRLEEFSPEIYKRIMPTKSG